MRRPLVIALAVAAVAVVLGIVAGVLIAQAADRASALDAHRAAATELTDARDEVEAPLTEADQVISLGGAPWVPAEPLSAVQSRADEVRAVDADAEAALRQDADALETDDVRAAARELEELADALADGAVDVDAALADLVTAVGETAPTVEAEAFDGENAPRIAFRDATADLADASDDQVAEYIASYLAAAEALAASHAEELAEKAGPLFDARMTVQAFARSMAGGVMLEFDWAPTVNGYGTGGSYGGTSYWNTADGGQATITLSDSVAAMWPGAGVQALVVHEVGHAILSRADCSTLFFDSDLYPGEEESWATAWAIGLGYTADGSGESIYGRPPDALIALSQQCR